MIAALYVEAGGVYAGRDGIDLWDELRDARTYQGPHRVIAHPPCARWGRWWWRLPGGLRAERPGEDGGCFEAAIGSVRAFGGVLEHPAGSLAWPRFGLPSPPSAGWARVMMGGWVCEVYQGHYGHRAPKPTWLYWVGEGEPPPADVGPRRRDAGGDHAG